MKNSINSDWAQLIKCETRGDEVQFELPVRSHSWARLVGLMLICSVLFVVLNPAKNLWNGVQELRRIGSFGGDVGLVLFILLFVFAGCIPVVLGLMISFGRCRVTWRDGQFRATEILGPLQWTRRLPRRPIHSFEVRPPQPSHQATVKHTVSGLAGLVIVFEDGTKKLLVLGYPRDALLWLAGELKSYVNTQLSTAPVEVIDTVAAQQTNAVAYATLEQPPDSNVHLIMHTNGFELQIPPLGIIRGGGNILLFGLVWCIVIGFAGMAATTVPLRGTGVRLLLIGILLVFWCIGLVALGVAINIGRHSAVIIVDGDRLRLETKGLFGAKQLELHAHELVTICASEARFTVDQQPLFELHLNLRDGKRVRLLTGRNERELAWIAAQLRAALHIPAGEKAL